ncbi:APC family permease [Maritalea sp.]|jgi:amino acid transporter|uniref:APC family permease n=1 Tax=Maritalea sp. TaxID=2003361 RepID=UPI0039E644AF
MSTQPTKLKRSLNLPLLILYGVGVTIGAGIFALIGEAMLIAGNKAPIGFVMAGVIASATGLSYAKLAAVYPRAAGEAVYVNIGLGANWGRIVGLGVTITAIISSAVIAISFAGYLGQLIAVPAPILVLGILAVLTGIACFGVKESVIFAAIITAIELGALIVIVWFGADSLALTKNWVAAFSPSADLAQWPAISSTALLAFFAFIGFEDIVNMAEETVKPQINVPRAVIATLVITVLIYTLVALIAVSAPDPNAIAVSEAPLATLFAQLTGGNGDLIAAAATIAMVNGILVQIVMAARVLFGMGMEGLLPIALAKLHPVRQTPVRATLLVAVLIAILALTFPLGGLAKTTSMVILTVFTLVNISLWRIGNQHDADPSLQRWKYLGLVGAALSGGLLMIEVFNQMTNLL